MKKPSKLRIQVPIKGKGKPPVMSNSTDELDVDLRPFYTSTEAAVQILCWLHGVKRRKYIPIDPNVILKQHPCLDELELSVRPLTKLYAYAMLKEQDAIRYGESTEAIQKLHEVHDYYLKLTNLHSCYQKDIFNELMMEPGSTLKFIDKGKGEDSYVERFELHKWICRTYNVKLINSSHSYPPSDASPVGKFEVTKVAVTSNSDTNGIEDEIRDAKGGLSEKSANSLYTTLALLVEAFVESKQKTGSGKAFGDPKDPNVDAIAKHLTILAMDVKSGNPISSQGEQSIRKRISKALKKRSAALKE